ncbi:hypothetical protein Desac_0901 [Desulfobacca acetoxidans DSM 11109]|uniref:Transcriptional coactivator p15 (PC4) C-terminal domain-containing protein n=1 Tax=Desulfobacca acetoxidans (strain ATCC 700848 / DSM 11109 / ASRB2) TaxID=880072 RepID=F2NH04_DESAR|nr:hypothetical protein Desac_0901 [Desulfobacca acetoxidans DSM 11109]
MEDQDLGTIILAVSSELVFSIGSYKGKHYAKIRKFVKTGKYSGPTKAGLSFTGHTLVALIKILQQLQASLPGVQEQEIARLPKTGDREIVVLIMPPDDVQSLPNIDIREYIESANFTGFSKKGVRFNWHKLQDVLALLQVQAQQLQQHEKQTPTLFPEARPEWVNEAEKLNSPASGGKDEVLEKLLPSGPKIFPEDFLDNVQGGAQEVELSSDVLKVEQQSDGTYAVCSEFGFCHGVRNPTEGNYLFYSWLRGKTKVQLPQEMITVFRTVKAYENYLRNLQKSLIQAYERKSGHRPIAEHRVKQVFNRYGLPWIEGS